MPSLLEQEFHSSSDFKAYASWELLKKHPYTVDSQHKKSLSKALADRHPDVREAAWAVIPHLDAGSCAAVLADLSWEIGLDAQTRCRLVKSLRALLDTCNAQHFRAIVAAVGLSNWWLRLAATELLQPLLEAAGPEVRLAAVDAVEELGDSMDVKVAGALAARIEDVDASVADAAFKLMEARLADPSADVRRIAVESLAVHAASCPKALAAVLDKLRDSNWLVRTAASHALEIAMPGKEASLAASSCLGHDDSAVRQAAAAAVAEL
ncbi:unnamed protein product, partial [Symbiodinium pilosum]